jgi:hypothetical protein
MSNIKKQELIKSVPQEVPMEVFINMIDAVEKEGGFDDIVANNLDLQFFTETHKETRAEILLTCLIEAAKLYENQSKALGRAIKFDIGIKLTPSFNGKHIGYATGYINKLYMGKPYLITSSTIGFIDKTQLSESEWGEQLFSFMIRDLFGYADLLNELRGQIKESDIIKEKLKSKNKKK